MNAIEVRDYARRMVDAHGTKAIAEAAQKAVAHESSGDTEQAKNWRRIEAALRQMQGPHES